MIEESYYERKNDMEAAMKKILTIVFTAALILSVLCACMDGNASPAVSPSPVITSNVTPTVRPQETADITATPDVSGSVGDTGGAVTEEDTGTIGSGSETAGGKN